MAPNDIRRKDHTSEKRHIRHFEKSRTGRCRRITLLHHTSPQETDHLARYPEEWNLTVEQEEIWINRVNASPSTMSILCYVNGEIAGNCELRLNGSIKTAHRATVAIALLKK